MQKYVSLCGKSNTGKTHILNALVKTIKEKNVCFRINVFKSNLSDYSLEKVNNKSNYVYVIKLNNGSKIGISTVGDIFDSKRDTVYCVKKHLEFLKKQNVSFYVFASHPGKIFKKLVVEWFEKNEANSEGSFICKKPKLDYTDDSDKEYANNILKTANLSHIFIKESV